MSLKKPTEEEKVKAKEIESKAYERGEQAFWEMIKAKQEGGKQQRNASFDENDEDDSYEQGKNDPIEVCNNREMERGEGRGWGGRARRGESIPNTNISIIL